MSNQLPINAMCNLDQPSSPSPFSQEGRRGTRLIQSPSPYLGEGFRVRVLGKVAHRVNDQLPIVLVLDVAEACLWALEAIELSFKELAVCHQMLGIGIV